jgi:hypothetical protein
MNQGESIIISAEALKTLRETRYNPTRYITATKLASMIDAFAYGDIREAALLWERIAETDDTIKSVKPKREKSVSGLTAVYEAKKGSGAAGDEQKAILETFWSSVRATDAYDRNISGGLRLLIQQWMYSASYRYAVHHIVWSPRRDGLTATFEHVPLWLFENKTGKLRFLRDPFKSNGEDMEPGEWLVTSGEGLMVAVSIGWLAKRETYNDWLIFSSRFSTPGVLGRTRAAQDSAEGKAMKAAVQAFGRDLKAVVYGDDGSIKDPIQLVQADGTPTGQPMPALIERIDRKFAALYRGSDLSTMSSGNGEGSGASLQGEEADILLADDVALCEEKFAEVSKMVLEWNFGSDVPILASVKLKKRSELDDETPAPKTTERPAIANAVVPEKKDEPAEALLDLVKAGFADVAALIERALNASGDERNALLQEAAALLPAQLENTELDDALSELLTTAFTGDVEEVENVGNADGAVKGWETRRRNGWQSKPRDKQMEVNKLVDEASGQPQDSSERIVVYGALTEQEAKLLGLGDGHSHAISNHYVRHMLKSHGDPKREEPRGQIAITPDDIKQIPYIIANSQAAQHAGLHKGAPTIRYFYDAPDGTTTVLEEVRKSKKMVATQLIKFKKLNLRNVPHSTK